MDSGTYTTGKWLSIYVSRSSFHFSVLFSTLFSVLCMLISIWVFSQVKKKYNGTLNTEVDRQPSQEHPYVVYLTSI